MLITSYRQGSNNRRSDSREEIERKGSDRLANMEDSRNTERFKKTVKLYEN